MPDWRLIMNKIICDVCGTSYPETASKCPICGYARPAGASHSSVASVLSATSEVSSYNYVKGGRFSKKNVRKRMRDENIEHVPVSVPAQEFVDDDEPIVNEKSTKGLTIAVLALLAAIVALTIYLVVRFFAPNLGAAQKPPVTTVPYTAAPTTTVPTTATIPCTGLDLDDTDVLLTFVGDSWRIDAVALPSDTTDVIQFFSSNESVATVSPSGEIRAVGEGSAVITVVCGDVSKECFVNCTVETVPPETTEPVVTEPVTEPTEPATEPTTEPTVPPTTEPSGDSTVVHTTNKTGKYTIRINGESRKNYDVSIAVGQSFTITLVDSNGNKQDVTWSASNSRVSINGNKITCNSSGNVNIFCVVDGEKYTCIVRIQK